MHGMEGTSDRDLDGASSSPQRSQKAQSNGRILEAAET